MGYLEDVQELVSSMWGEAPVMKVDDWLFLAYEFKVSQSNLVLSRLETTRADKLVYRSSGVFLVQINSFDFHGCIRTWVLMFYTFSIDDL